MTHAILRKPEAQIELAEIERRYQHAERRLAAMKATRSVPWHEIELAEMELDAIRRRLAEMRKGAAG